MSYSFYFSSCSSISWLLEVIFSTNWFQSSEVLVAVVFIRDLAPIKESKFFLWVWRLLISDFISSSDCSTMTSLPSSKYFEVNYCMASNFFCFSRFWSSGFSGSSGLFWSSTNDLQYIFSSLPSTMWIFWKDWKLFLINCITLSILISISFSEFRSFCSYSNIPFFWLCFLS